MALCPLTCKVREEAANLELEDQLALIQGCWVANMVAYAKCSADQHALAAWINAD